jgi:hypothetical protein
MHAAMNTLTEQRIEVPEGVLVRELQGESVLLNLDSESYFGLDDVGTRMWHALATTASAGAAFEVLLAEFDVSPEELGRDLAEFIAALSAAGLVRVTPA